MIKCPECGKDVSSKAEACPQCGYPIASHIKTCPECGNDVTSESDFCPQCGYPIASPAKGSEGPKDAPIDEAQGQDDSSAKEATEANKDIAGVKDENVQVGSNEVSIGLVDETDTSSHDKKDNNSDTGTVNPWMKKARVIGIIVVIALAIFCIFQIYSCADAPLKSVTSIAVSYKSNGSVSMNNDTYTLLAGTAPEQSDLTVSVTYDDKTKDNIASKDLTFRSIDGPVPLENGKTTTYEVSFKSKYAHMISNAPIIEKAQLKFEGADVESITDATYGGKAEEGEVLSSYSFKITVNYSNGTIARKVEPQSVEGPMLVANQTCTYTVTYGGKSATVEVTGVAKEPEPKEAARKKKKSTKKNTTDSKKSSSSKNGTSSSSEGASYKASCVSVTYENLILNEDAYIDKSVKFKGKVLKVLGTGVVTNSYAVCMTKLSGNKWEDPVYMDVTVSHLKYPLSVGDICTFYGDYDGIVSSSSVGLPGGNIPSLAVDYVDFG